VGATFVGIVGLVSVSDRIGSWFALAVARTCDGLFSFILSILSLASLCAGGSFEVIHYRMHKGERIRKHISALVLE
jgi:hypothetical protein